MEAAGGGVMGAEAGGEGAVSQKVHMHKGSTRGAEGGASMVESERGEGAEAPDGSGKGARDGSGGGG